MSTRETVTLEALGVAEGIAIGPAHVVESGVERVVEYRIAASRVASEQERFEKAVAHAAQQLVNLKTKTRAMGGAAAEEVGYLLEAHMQMLGSSRLVRGVALRIEQEAINAEAAVQREIDSIARSFQTLADPYFAARAEDVRDVGRRLILSLGGKRSQPFENLPAGAVVIAREITPADTALLDPDRVAGFAAELGGNDSHTAIMARSLGLPAVLAAPNLLGRVADGDIVVLDGASGEIVIRPDEETVAFYRRRRAQTLRRRRALDRLKAVPSQTRDGQAVTLQANIELPVEAEQAMAMGAAGIGLLRSEFLFMAPETPPDEETQYRELAPIVETMKGLPVTIRTLDIGFDKLPRSLAGNINGGDNPALGLRAIRLGLKQPALLETQLAAILRAGAHGPVRIMVPMITVASEMEAVRQSMQRVARRLRRRKVPIAEPLPPLGAMIEVPGAALSADALARVSDFFSIGTNDLTMYTLALDRTNEQVAHLFDPLHLGVLRLMQFAIAAAHRAGIPVNVCGEIAGDPRFTALLLGLGVRDVSMATASILRVKRRVRQLDCGKASRGADEIMAQSDPARAAALLDSFNGGARA